jgi:hypothetical protein
VIGTDAAFGAIRLVFSPDVPICRTPCGGVTLTRLAYPVNSALTTIFQMAVNRGGGADDRGRHESPYELPGDAQAAAEA